MARVRIRRFGWWLGGGLVALALLITGGTWIYIHEIEAPSPLPLSVNAAPASISPSVPQAASDSYDIAGVWHVSAGSIAGYRVNEELAGQSNLAVGRTSNVTGSISISGTTVTAGSFTVQMATLKSNNSERDAQFRGRIMDTARYPTARLALTAPVALGTPPSGIAINPYYVTANLTLRGQTEPVAFTLMTVRSKTGFEVYGAIPVLFSTWDIPTPNIAGIVTTQNQGLVEFLLKLSR